MEKEIFTCSRAPNPPSRDRHPHPGYPFAGSTTVLPEPPSHLVSRIMATITIISTHRTHPQADARLTNCPPVDTRSGPETSIPQNYTITVDPRNADPAFTPEKIHHYTTRLTRGSICGNRTSSRASATFKAAEDAVMMCRVALYSDT